MALKQKFASAVISPPLRAGRTDAEVREPEGSDATAAFLLACEAVLPWPREDLIAVAVARGCRHYATVWPEVVPIERPDLPHEILGCALLRGPADLDTFQTIRCGAMVLGDLGNLPARIALAAKRLDVVGRVAHIAALGCAVDHHAGFWREVLAGLPAASPAEKDYLPGISRLVSETRMSGLGRGPVRVWLRTDYRR